MIRNGIAVKPSVPPTFVMNNQVLLSREGNHLQYIRSQLVDSIYFEVTVISYSVLDMESVYPDISIVSFCLSIRIVREKLKLDHDWHLPYAFQFTAH